MSYPENNELDNDNSWNDEELNNNEAGNTSINNDSIDYNWDTEGVEYFDDFNWSENNEQDKNKDWNQDSKYEEEHWNEDNIQETNWSENTIEDIEDIDEADDVVINNKADRLQGIPGPIGPQGPPGPGAEFIKELCIKPMYHILKQLNELIADDIEIGTEKQGTILDCMIVKLDEYIVIVRNSFREITIPIHQIVGIYSRRLPQVLLLPERDNNKTGDCDCCERPLREYCSNHIGQDYTINTTARDEIFSNLKGNITKVGEGVVILSNTVAILICKIISIEKDARSSIRNYDENEQ